MYDVTVDGVGYALTAVGPCVDPELAVATKAGGKDSPTTSTSTTTTTTRTAPAPAARGATTTTTAPPATTTTTAALVRLKLSSVCTEPAHWPDERAWLITNPNAVDVDFTLDAVRATNHDGHLVVGAAAPGNTIWYLPAADRGRNRATLDAVGRRRSVNSTDRRC